MPSKPMSSPATPPEVSVTRRFRFSWNMRASLLSHRHRYGHCGSAQERRTVETAGDRGVLRGEAAVPHLDNRRRVSAGRTSLGNVGQTVFADLDGKIRPAALDIAA